MLHTNDNHKKVFFNRTNSKDLRLQEWLVKGGLTLSTWCLAYALSACGANVPVEEVVIKDPKETKAQEVAREEKAIAQENATIDAHTTPTINHFNNYGSLNGFYNSQDNLNSPMQNGMYGGYYMPYGMMPYGYGMMPGYFPYSFY
ncbi:hypothetical protein [Helicobacter cetorum]|uniref:Uncharacterized protein n=1 Tax=Helicobacter cetorum (strain ATCC BAA-429 / MIT 00-7128) TaxID=182217 RepID=I0ENM3_HELC0|nr:hypothetical protein [Helicobacter cetorum]AFI04542.1 hypothetical protein HCW_06410 [Helicobacter cetorum MIT 00-7128]